MYISIMMLFYACKSTKKTQNADLDKIETVAVQEKIESTQPVIVYKTKSDYFNLVPVVLSDDKSKIISYPSPTDINSSLLPTKLKNGYLIDNKGIQPNVAFLSFTYDEYSKLKEVPTLIELQKLIIDKDPLLEYCNCGKRNLYKNLYSDIIQLINEDKLKIKCKKIK
ncbi:MAG TPA: hypothetical protein PK431_01040 [Chitinophagales bacterium]|nr:hypothetical protein [Chitinophagales bacterium]